MTTGAKVVVGAISLVGILGAAIAINNIFPPVDHSKVAVSAMDIDNGDLKINWERYNSYEIDLSSTNDLAITNSGTYRLKGESDQPVIINAGTGVVKLILDNVTIKNSSGPAIACYSADDLVIELVGDNDLADGSSYSSEYDEDVTGTIYSKSDTTFQGEGSLELTGNFQDAIVSKDDLKFTNGKYVINAADDGIRGKDSVYIVDGEFNIVSKGDAIKSTNTTTAGKGFVLIENGDIKIASGDDAIHAESILEVRDGTIYVEKSYEGLEAPKIVINGGDIAIAANDDGINAGSSSNNTTATNNMMQDADANCEIIVNAGTVYVNAAGDGIDSNGYIYFNGGEVIVDGPTNNGNGALDAGIAIYANGANVIAVGSSGMAETLGSSSAVNNISVYFSTAQKAKTEVSIKDSSGEVIVGHTSAKTFSHMAMSTKKFETGKEYTIYINGEKYQTFTILDTTTVVGENTTNNMNTMPGRGMTR